MNHKPKKETKKPDEVIFLNLRIFVVDQCKNIKYPEILLNPTFGHAHLLLNMKYKKSHLKLQFCAKVLNHPSLI